jgi:hypothetical protein
MRITAVLGPLLALTLLASPTVAQAQAGTPTDGSTSERWRFSVVPYFWAANLDGTMKLDGLPETDASASFTDLLENLDFAAASFFVARKGPWVVLADLSYAALAVDETVGTSSVEIDSTTAWFSFGLGYTVSQSLDGSIDLFAGARYMDVNNDAQSTGGTTASFSKSEDWIDPIVGFNARAALSNEFELALAGDIGGFGVGSDLTYQLMPTATFLFNQTFSLHFGYRWFDTDFEDSDFKYDVTQSGWLLGLGFGF